MIIDAYSLPPGASIEADVCVVGAGVAGLTLAQEMFGSKLSVCLLESGGFEREEDAHALSEGESIGITYCKLEEMRERRVGGTSHRWIHSLGRNDPRFGARMRPLDEVDFEKRDGVPHSGWPFPKAHLDPYYARAESAFDIHPRPYDIEHWGANPRRGPLRFEGDELRTAVLKIGPRDPFTDVYPRQIRDARNVTLYTHANVLEVEMDETGGSVTSLRVSSLQGKEFRAKADLFVLATGGIETPRLLLLSDGTHAAGLGNDRCLVGRFYMEHPHFRLGWFIPADRSSRRAADFYRTHSEAGARVLGNIAVSESLIRREGLLNLGITLGQRLPDLPTPPSRRGLDSLREVHSALKLRTMPHELATHLKNVATDAHVISRRATAKAHRRLNNLIAPVFQLVHMTEQTPNPDSRVKLSHERDSFGQRRVCLDWRLQDRDMEGVVRSHEIINDNLVRSGLGRLEVARYEEIPPQGIRGGYHSMGATRMHNDPAQGVVDEHCRVHGVANLFIAGSSVFPTGGFANPTLTIGALTIRLADHFRGLLKKRGPSIVPRGASPEQR